MGRGGGGSIIWVGKAHPKQWAQIRSKLVGQGQGGRSSAAGPGGRAQLRGCSPATPAGLRQTHPRGKLTPAVPHCELTSV